MFNLETALNTTEGFTINLEGPAWPVVEQARALSILHIEEERANQHFTARYTMSNGWFITNIHQWDAIIEWHPLTAELYYAPLTTKGALLLG